MASDNNRYIFYKDINVTDFSLVGSFDYSNSGSDIGDIQKQLQRLAEICGLQKIEFVSTGGWLDFHFDHTSGRLFWTNSTGTVCHIYVQDQDREAIRLKIGENPGVICTQDSSKTFFSTSSNSLYLTHIGFAMGIEYAYNINLKSPMPWWNASLVSKVTGSYSEDIPESQVIYINENDQLKETDSLRKIAVNKTQSDFYINNKSIKNITWSKNNLDQPTLNGYIVKTLPVKNTETNLYNYNPLFNFTPEWYPEVIGSNLWDEIKAEGKNFIKIDQEQLVWEYYPVQGSECDRKTFPLQKEDQVMFYIRRGSGQDWGTITPDELKIQNYNTPIFNEQGGINTNGIAYYSSSPDVHGNNIVQLGMTDFTENNCSTLSLNFHDEDMQIYRLSLKNKYDYVQWTELTSLFTEKNSEVIELVDRKKESLFYDIIQNKTFNISYTVKEGTIKDEISIVDEYGDNSGRSTAISWKKPNITSFSQIVTFKNVPFIPFGEKEPNTSFEANSYTSNFSLKNNNTSGIIYAQCTTRPGLKGDTANQAMHSIHGLDFRGSVLSKDNIPLGKSSFSDSGPWTLSTDLNYKIPFGGACGVAIVIWRHRDVLKPSPVQLSFSEPVSTEYAGSEKINFYDGNDLINTQPKVRMLKANTEGNQNIQLQSKFLTAIVDKDPNKNYETFTTTATCTGKAKLVEKSPDETKCIFEVTGNCTIDVKNNYTLPQPVKEAKIQINYSEEFDGGAFATSVGRISFFDDKGNPLLEPSGHIYNSLTKKIKYTAEEFKSNYSTAVFNTTPTCTGKITLDPGYTDYEGYFTINGDGTITVTNEYIYQCLVRGTPITIINDDGSLSTKNIEDITYDDNLLSWDFNRGIITKTKPCYLSKPQYATFYWKMTLSNGRIINLVGTNEKSHRFFNVTKQKFMYPQDFEYGKDLLYSDDNNVPTVTILSCERILCKNNSPVEYYTIEADYHLNYFAGGVMSGCRFSNIYPIQDMRYQIINRPQNKRQDYQAIPDQLWYGLRLAEQDLDSIGQSKNNVQYYNNVIDHIQHNYIEHMREVK